MSDLSALKNAPDISFIDSKTIDDVRSELVADYESYMANASGQARPPAAFQPPPGYFVCRSPANLSGIPVC